MKHQERIRALIKIPQLLFDVLFRARYRFVYDQMPVETRGMNLKKRFNLMKSGGNLLYRKLSAWSMPLHMQFELTNYCNLKCPVCPTGTGLLERKPEFMSPQLFEDIMDQVGPYLLTASLWAWGEPLLHPELKKILKASRKHNVATFLSTNGQNLNTDRVLEAVTAEPPTYLIVALDGLTDEINSVFRKGAKLEGALEGVRKIAAIKEQNKTQFPILHMRFIVMNHNQHQVSQLEKFAREHHFDYLSVRTLSIIDSERPDDNHLQMIPDETAYCAYNYQDESRVEKKDFICMEPFWFPSVFADGMVVPCEQDYKAQLPMGKISSGNSFRDIWYSRKAQDVRSRIRDQADSLSFCRNCPYRDRDTTDVSIKGISLNQMILPATSNES